MGSTRVLHEADVEEHLQDITVRMHQWSEVGDELSGYLLERNDVELDNGKKAKEYVLQLEGGAGIETFLETRDIEKAFRYLRFDPTHCWVVITYLGNKDIGREDGGKMKMFQTRINQLKKLPNCATIGNRDIPF